MLGIRKHVRCASCRHHASSASAAQATHRAPSRHAVFQPSYPSSPCQWHRTHAPYASPAQHCRCALHMPSTMRMRIPFTSTSGWVGVLNRHLFRDTVAHSATIRGADAELRGAAVRCVSVAELPATPTAARAGAVRQAGRRLTLWPTCLQGRCRASHAQTSPCSAARAAPRRGRTAA